MEAVYLWSAVFGITAAILIALICVCEIVSWISEWFFNYKDGEEWKDDKDK